MDGKCYHHFRNVLSHLSGSVFCSCCLATNYQQLLFHTTLLFLAEKNIQKFSSENLSTIHISIMVCFCLTINLQVVSLSWNQFLKCLYLLRTKAIMAHHRFLCILLFVNCHVEDSGVVFRWISRCFWIQTCPSLNWLLLKARETSLPGYLTVTLKVKWIQAYPKMKLKI